MTRIKICGITNLDDAKLAVDLGVDALGFVFEQTSPRCIRNSPLLIEILAMIPLFVQKVAVFAHQDIEVPFEFDAVQRIRPLDTRIEPSLKVIQTIRIGESDSDVSGADCDAFLLDAYDPSAYGGTGKTISWNDAATLVRSSPKPVILAGGLNPNNVAEAIRIVRPYAVDVSSGLESEPGKKDPDKMKAFIEAIRQTD